MRCPYCKSDNTRVVDSRASADGFTIRRRRACRDCERRYTTYERVEGTTLRVVKKSGERVEFDRGKLLGGLMRATEKRPVTTEQLENLADEVERQCNEAFDKEVPSKVIGELIMEGLRALDQVAYVRFASVYREFKDVNQFMRELEGILGRGSSGGPSAGGQQAGGQQAGGQSAGWAGSKGRAAHRPYGSDVGQDVPIREGNALPFPEFEDGSEVRAVRRGTDEDTIRIPDPEA